MRKMEIKARVQQVIRQRRAQLEKEVKLYEEKMHDTESVFGFGGAYRRQEEARDRRQQQLYELDDFEEQLRSVTKHIEVDLYFFGCRSCGAVCFTTREPFSDWHECPTCRQMINLNQCSSRRVKIVDEGAMWQDALKEALNQ